MSNQEEALDKISDYISAEVTASLRDYEFITKLNKTATRSFKDYQQVAERVAKNVNKINENQVARQRLERLVETINEIDSKVSVLEASAYKIDSYSKRLEEQFKRLVEPDTSERK